MRSLIAVSVVSAVVALGIACGNGQPNENPQNPLNPESPTQPTDPAQPEQPTQPTNPTQPMQTDELPALPSTPPQIFAPTYVRDGTVPNVDFDVLVADPAKYQNQTIEVRGVVRASCQVRGCWMEVRSVRDAKSESITVRFINYSFFVPLDSRGADVRFQGVVEILARDDIEAIAHMDLQRLSGFDLLACDSNVHGA